MSSHRIGWRRWIAPATLAVAIFASFLLGGSNRIDVVPLLVLRPLLVLCMASLMVIAPWRDWTGLRAPLLLLGALAIVIGAQLIPLPPGLWSHIPGHAPFLEANALIGDMPWRPLNLTPDRGWVSLLSLGGPLVALVGLAACRRQDWRMLTTMLVLVVLSTAVVGTVQVLGGTAGPARFYPGTHLTEAVGLFANRNHQALFLAMGFPLLRCWTLDNGRSDTAADFWKPISAGLIALMLIPVILLTGSRSGLLMAAVGLLGAAWMGLPTVTWMSRFSRIRQERASRVAFSIALVALPLALLGATILFGRAVAVQRLFTLSVEADRRSETLSAVLELIRTHWLFGSGFGSFDPLFRVYEPNGILRQTFFNHAHNDLFELTITGGLPALLVLLAFLSWMVRAAVTVLRHQPSARDLPYARLGIVLLVMVLLASLSDYPLRTPAMALVIGLAVGWIGKATVPPISGRERSARRVR